MYKLLARYYDQIHSSLTADLPFVLKLARKSRGPVLDLGCGTGRLLIPLAKDGIQIVGVDNSPEMLNIASKRLAIQTKDVRALVSLWEKDMRELDQDHAKTKFTLALFSYNTLLHMREEETGDLLRRVAGLLYPGGEIFIDVENPFLLTQTAEQKEAVFETRLIDEVTNERVELWSQSSLDSLTQTFTVTWQFRTQEKASGIPTIEIIYNYLYPHQIVLLLQHAGFRLQQMMGGYQGEPFEQDSERLLLLANLP